MQSIFLTYLKPSTRTFGFMKLETAYNLASFVLAELKPHCIRAEIAGSIRRRKPEVKDIEIVLIPKPYEIGLFSSGVATVINQWAKVKGELPCKYTQRILPGGTKLDLFFCEPENWGYIFALRTGSQEFNIRTLMNTWKAKGYEGRDGSLMLYGRPVALYEEEDLFSKLGLGWVKPEDRK